MAAVVLALCPVMARPQPASRQDEIAKIREQKTQTLHAYARPRVERMLLWLEDRRVVERVFNPPHGLFVRVGRLAEGAGFAVGPAYRLRASSFSVTVSGVLSTKGYSLAEAALDAPDLARGRLFAHVTARRFEFPEEIFFGSGRGSLERARTNFALRATAAQGSAGIRIRPWLTAGGAFEYVSPRIGRGTDRRFPSTDVVFTEAGAPGLSLQPDFLRGEPFVAADTTDSGNPTRGGRYQLSYAWYADRDLDRYSFERLNADARHYVPLLRGSHVLALHARVSSSQAGAGQQVPFYLEETLGGAYSLRGFSRHRFRDRQLLLLQAEYRWDLNAFASGALFIDAGKVAARARDLDLHDLSRNYGFGLRVGSRAGVALRADVAFGSGEGARLVIRFNDVF